MIAVVKKAFDNLFGAGEAAVTVPPLDGAFQPNTVLDTAECVVEQTEPDNLIEYGGRVMFSSGGSLMRLAADGRTEMLESFGAPISALASDGAGRIAIAIEGQDILLRDDASGERRIEVNSFSGAHCVTAIAFAADGGLVVASGSARHGPSDWARNLMERRHDGTVWHVPAGDPSRARRLASGLAWPSGLLVRSAESTQIVVAEAWRHRLLGVAMKEEQPKVLLDNLPAYPGRLQADKGDVWLSCFAPRSQLIEFVLREATFRKRMLNEVEPEFWVAPAMRSGRSFREPLQGGAVKQLGVLKPWAPTRSYGLLVRLDGALQPRSSYHSRADGSRHGITSALATADGLLVTSRGGDALLRLKPDASRGGEKQ